MSTTLAIETPQYHRSQKTVFLKPKAPIIICICGTKWGKTWGATKKSIFLCNSKPSQHVWWVGHTYDACRISRTRTFDMLWPNDPDYRRDLDTKEKDPAEYTWNQWKRCGQIPSKITYKSAEIPKSLKGWGPTYILGDEINFWAYEAFTNLITTTTQTEAQVILFTTPGGKGTWPHREWKKGHKEADEYDEAYDPDNEFPLYQSYRFPSTDNTEVDPDRIEQIKQTMPLRLFQQEYLAMWVDEGGCVFPHINLLSCMSPEPRWISGHVYVVGWDPAISDSDSAWTVMDVTNWPFREIECGTFPIGTRWETQWTKIVTLSKKYKACVAYDDTGGAAKGVHKIELRRQGVKKVHKVDYAGKKPGKVAVINNFIYLMEQKSIKLQKNSEWEEQMESYLVDSTGISYKYKKPKHGKDDMIDARAVACWRGMKLNPKGISIEKVRESKKILTHRELKSMRIREMINSTKKRNHDFMIQQLCAAHVPDPEAFLKDPTGYRMRYEEETERLKGQKEERVLCH